VFYAQSSRTVISGRVERDVLYTNIKKELGCKQIQESGWVDRDQLQEGS